MEGSGELDPGRNRTHHRPETRYLRPRAPDGRRQKTAHLRIRDGHYRKHADARRGGLTIRAFPARNIAQRYSFHFTKETCRCGRKLRLWVVDSWARRRPSASSIAGSRTW